jgi:hypothetical protein
MNNNLYLERNICLKSKHNPSQISPKNKTKWNPSQISQKKKKRILFFTKIWCYARIAPSAALPTSNAGDMNKLRNLGALYA